MPSAETVMPHRGFDYGAKDEIYPTPALMRMLLPEFGWRITCEAYSLHSKLPRTTIHRHDNAFVFTVYAPDTTVKMSLSTPYGAPLFTECNVMLRGGCSEIHPSRTWRKECRCFVKQESDDAVSAEIQMQHWPEYSHLGCRRYGPFKDAEVRFFPEKGTRKDGFEAVVTPWSILTTPPYPYSVEETPDGICFVMRHVTGYLFCMPMK